MNRRPNANEFNPYYQTYVGKVGEGNILSILEQQEAEMASFYESIPEDRWEYRYAEGKWTPKEVLLHIIDAERVFSYRALRVGRADTTPMPGFDQDPYVETSAANDRTPASLIAEYRAVRQATLALFKNLPASAWDQLGTASDSPISPLALACIIAGHEIHHSMITKERYLV
ncbi:MAG: DinB family protein [Saprospiraceae bacterium]|nr:DinB family protein [Saprospiraceae bacterium]